MAYDIAVKRVYEPAARADGQRVLIDRVWPRGITKEKAALTLWLKDIAPSAELRTWFGHDPARWDEFRHRYRDELLHRPELLGELRSLAQHGPVTLVYSAHDQLHNDAIVLRDVLLGRKTGSSAEA